MTQRIHFISGLPRSGSTLLAAILRQNPRFHAAMTSPVGSLFSSLLHSMSQSEASVFISEGQRQALLRGVFDNYYAEFAQSPVIFDTNQVWCAKLAALSQLFPMPKVMCCVRDLAWVMDSFERIIRKYPLQHSRMFSESEASSVYSRVETMAKRDRVVGFAWSALKEAFYGDQAQALLLVEYELLAQAPEKCLRLIYQFLDEPYYQHDFEQVAYEAELFDTRLGLPGLHTVRGKVSFEPRASILPPDVFQQYSGMSFWRDQTGSRASVITVAKEG